MKTGWASGKEAGDSKPLLASCLVPNAHSPTHYTMAFFLLKWISKLGKLEKLHQRMPVSFQKTKVVPSYKEDEELSRIMGVP